MVRRAIECFRVLYTFILNLHLFCTHISFQVPAIQLSVAEVEAAAAERATRAARPPSAAPRRARTQRTTTMDQATSWTVVGLRSLKTYVRLVANFLLLLLIWLLCVRFVPCALLS